MRIPSPCLRPQSRVRPGFTLIELMVSLAVTLIVSAAAFELFVIARKNQDEGYVKSSLSRDAQLTLDWIERDLTYLGVGIPRGCPRDSDINGADCHLKALRPAVRVGTSDALAFFGDLPLPNSEFTGIMQIAYFHDEDGHGDDDEEDGHHPAVVSDLSGCVPAKGGTDSGNHQCITTAATMINVGSPTNDCTSSAITEPTCPWGLNKLKLADTEIVVVGFPDGSWARRRLDAVQAKSDYAVVHFNHTQPGSIRKDLDNPTDCFNGRSAACYISYIDRVFYSLESTVSDSSDSCSGDNCVLKRNQCWGPWWDPSDANFPPVQSTAIRSSTTPLGCSAPNDGTGWTVLMTGIKSLKFRYFLDSVTELTGEWNREKASKTRLIQVDLVMERKLPRSQRKVVHRVSRQVFLENRGGITANPSVALSDGGCFDNGSTINDCEID